MQRQDSGMAVLLPVEPLLPVEDQSLLSSAAPFTPLRFSCLLEMHDHQQWSVPP